jgi:predicted DNA-binding transcriptional regulator AlpA
MAQEIYLTEAEFAGRYHLGRRTVQRWRQTGDGPPWIRLGSRRVLYRLSDCEVWAAARTFLHRADELSRSARPNIRVLSPRKAKSDRSE